MSYVLKADSCSQVGFRVERDNGEPVEEANRFLQTLWARALSPHTIRTYGFGLVVLYRWMEATSRRLDALTNDDLMSWIIAQRERGGNAHTINHRLLTCRLLFRYVVGRDMPSRAVAHPSSRYLSGHIIDHRL